MTLQHKIGTFTKPASGVTGSQAITNVGFQPKVLIITSEAQTSLNTTLQNDIRSVFGFSTGASESACLRLYALGGGAATSTARHYFSTDLIRIGSGTTAAAVASLTSFDSDGFTLNWTTNTEAAFQIGYVALGGDDVVNAKVITDTLDIAVASQSFTGAGFTPNTMFFFGGVSPAGANQNHIVMFLGMQAGSEGHSVQGYVQTASGTMNSNMSHSSVSHSTQLKTKTPSGGQDSIGSFAFTSDGVDVTYSDQSATAIPIAFLFMNLSESDMAGSLRTQPTASNPEDLAYTLSPFQPALTFFLHSGLTSTTTSGNSMTYGFGVDDGTNRWSNVVYDTDNIANSDSVSAFNDSASMMFAESSSSIGTHSTAVMTSDGYLQTFNPNSMTGVRYASMTIGSVEPPGNSHWYYRMLTQQ